MIHKLLIQINEKNEIENGSVFKNIVLKQLFFFSKLYRLFLSRFNYS